MKAVLFALQNLNEVLLFLDKYPEQISLYSDFNNIEKYIFSNLKGKRHMREVAFLIKDLIEENRNRNLDIKIYSLDKSKIGHKRLHHVAHTWARNILNISDSNELFKSSIPPLFYIYDYSLLLSKILDQVKQRCPKPVYDTWFSDLSFEMIRHADVAVFGTSSRTKAEWLHHRYKPLIESTLRDLTNRHYIIHFILRINGNSNRPF